MSTQPISFTTSVTHHAKKAESVNCSDSQVSQDIVGEALKYYSAPQNENVICGLPRNLHFMILSEVDRLTSLYNFALGSNRKMAEVVKMYFVKHMDQKLFKS